MTATEWKSGKAGGTPLAADHFNAMIADTAAAQDRADAAYSLAESNGPGTPGTDGADGADGKSAYEIAQDEGFSGTETEWLTSLQGPQGDKGDPGDTGPQGPAGETGDLTTASQIVQAWDAASTDPRWKTVYTDADFTTSEQNTAEHWVNMKGGVHTDDPNLTAWLNEWGALRGTPPYNWGDALVRGIRTDDDGFTGSCAVEIADRRTGATANRMWGRNWDDGSLVRNDQPTTEVYTWATGDADPTVGGTVNLPTGAIWLLILGASDTRPTWAPPGSLIVRKSA